nr:MAG TPA: hypothetical protein [Caudoviricetes sp.]
MTDGFLYILFFRYKNIRRKKVIIWAIVHYQKEL